MRRRTSSNERCHTSQLSKKDMAYDGKCLGEASHAFRALSLDLPSGVERVWKPIPCVAQAIEAWQVVSAFEL